MVKFRFLVMKKALIGYGGHAREVMSQMGTKLPCFVDDEYVTEDTLPLSKLDINEYEVMVAVADTRSRYDIVQKLPKKTKFFTFIHPTALILDENIEIGEGSFIGAYSILTTNIKLGDHSILNRSNHIGHDTTIGSYFSSMPGAIVSGNVTIYDLVYIGNNSSIREKLSIHSLSTIGMNSAVVKNIIEPGIYVGCPAKKIK
jgi:sugar O-acyltransferase (sialic acid O-acetyltransferase NeuD family)